MSFYVPKTSRKKGVHKLAPSSIPKAGKGGLIGSGGGVIKAPSFPKLPKLSMPKLPTTHTNKSRY